MKMNINEAVVIINAKIQDILQKSVRKRIIAAKMIMNNINLKFLFIYNFNYNFEYLHTYLYVFKI